MRRIIGGPLPRPRPFHEVRCRFENQPRRSSSTCTWDVAGRAPCRQWPPPKKNWKRKSRKPKISAQKKGAKILYAIHSLPQITVYLQPALCNSYQNKGKPFRHDRRVILGQGSGGHSQVRAHQAWRRDSHLRRSSGSIELSRWGRGRWCVRGHTGGQLFEGRKLRRQARGMTRDCA